MKTKTIWLIFIVIVSLFVLFQNKSSNTMSKTNLGTSSWTIEYEKNEKILSQPIMVDDKLYIQTKNRISVYEIIDGALLWASDLPVEEITAGTWHNAKASVQNSQLIIQSQRNLISVLDANTGKLIWSTRYPIDTNNGYLGDDTFVVDLAVEGEYLLVSRHNTILTAYDIEDGRVIWNSEVPTRTSLEIMPTLNRVFVGSLDTILEYDLGNGKLPETHQLPGDALSYAIVENWILITFDNGECTIAALNTETLLDDWCIRLPGSGFGAYYLFGAMDGDIVYLYGDYLVALTRLNGEIVWSIKAEEEFEHMTILEDQIFAMDAGNFYIFDKHTGTGIGRLDIPVEITNSIFDPQLSWSPIVTKDRIILFTDNLANGHAWRP